MDEVVARRVVGVLTLAIAAFLLSWLLPRPGLERLRGEQERVVTMDLTRADSRPEEAPLPASGDDEAFVGSARENAEPQAPPTAPGETQRDQPVAPAPVPPVAAQDDAPPALPDPDPVDVIALPTLPPTGEARPVPKPAPKPEGKPAPKPDVKPEPKPAVKPEIKPEPKPAAPPVAKPAEPTPKPAVATPTPKPAASGKIVVQAGAYSLLDKAEGVRARASARGVSCFISPAETAKGTLYRLRCGPFADRAKADAAVNALKGDGIQAQVVSGG